MIDWINAVLRALMCLGFLILVVKPMLMVFTRREFNHAELEDAAQSSVNSAFQAWRVNHGSHYYDNPEYAEMMASNPSLVLPDLSKPKEPEQITKEIDSDKNKDVVVASELKTENVEDSAGQTENLQAASTDTEKLEEVKVDEEDSVKVAETEEDESMDAIKAKLAEEKKKKKAQSVPPELLNNANTYEDKLMVVRLITEQDHGRVAAVLKKMIQGGA
jgi:hypothetical protein